MFKSFMSNDENKSGRVMFSNSNNYDAILNQMGWEYI